jgi:hypothetical protein
VQHGYRQSNTGFKPQICCAPARVLSASYYSGKTKLDSVKCKIDSAARELKQAYDKNKGVALSLQGVESIYNPGIIKKAIDILNVIDNEINKIGDAVTQIKKFP